MDINDILLRQIDLGYRDFARKLCPATKYEILGVRIPILRKISQKLLKEFDAKTIFTELDDDSFEAVMLRGFIIANLKISEPERQKLILEYLPKIDNWSLCDTFCGELKIVRGSQAEYFAFLSPLLKFKPEFTPCFTEARKDSAEFTLRFAVVMLLDYFLDDKYFDATLEILKNIQSEDYYVNMAVAWAMATALTKDFDKTFQFLNQNRASFDDFTFNKSLQKGLESFKLNSEQKEILRKMKNI